MAGRVESPAVRRLETYLALANDRIASYVAERVELAGALQQAKDEITQLRDQLAKVQELNAALAEQLRAAQEPVSG